MSWKVLTIDRHMQDLFGTSGGAVSESLLAIIGESAAIYTYAIFIVCKRLGLTIMAAVSGWLA